MNGEGLVAASVASVSPSRSNHAQQNRCIATNASGLELSTFEGLRLREEVDLRGQNRLRNATPTLRGGPTTHRGLPDSSGNSETSSPRLGNLLRMFFT